MKNFLFTLAIFFTFHTSHAQTYSYVPIPTANASWKLTNRLYYRGGGAICIRHQYNVLGKDTIVGVDTFHELQVLGKTESGNPGTHNCDSNKAFATPFYSTPGKMWMIEKQKKVYLCDSLPLDTSVNKPFIDFSWFVGQAVAPPAVPYYDTVLYIDTVMINGSLRKRIVVRFRAPVLYGVFADTVIEGIGSLRFGLGFRDFLRTGQDDVVRARLLCFEVNSFREYSYANELCADLWATSVDDKVSAEDGITISPNPFMHEVQVTGTAGCNISVYNTLGMSMYSRRSVSANKVSIQAANWPTGMYILVAEKDGQKRMSRLMKY